MIRRNTWIVLGVFVGLLGVFLWWSQQAAPTGEAEPTSTPAALWQVTSDQIRQILVEDLSSGVRISASREAEVGWVVSEPAGAIQDVGRVERAATWLTAPTPRSNLGPQPDLEPFGLVTPSFRVTVTLAGGTDLMLEIGRDTPTGSSRYVRFEGQPDILVFTSAGLDEVLGLLTELVPTPTPTITVTSSVTATPQATVAVPGVTPLPTETPTP